MTNNESPKTHSQDAATNAPGRRPQSGGRRRRRKPQTVEHGLNRTPRGERSHGSHHPQLSEGERNALVEEITALATDAELAVAHRLPRRLHKAHSARALEAISADVAASVAKVAHRIAALPSSITFPEQLPVSARVDDIAAALADHQVVIVAGETGSGKTTQLPKLCLDMGRGRRARIGHTQPRRLAARSVAERIAEELGQPIGESVGYSIRFDDAISDDTAIKVMTDGILLAELQRDRDLLGYDTIIIDEAHERSLNIDFLLGYLKQLLPRRKDLKVIITSATIDPERFAQHFADAEGNPAPIIEVSGRTYPVEIRYRPLVTVEPQGHEHPVEVMDGVVAAVDELLAEGSGDILVFFPTERDIREAVQALEPYARRGIEIIPLFGRLSNQEQMRVFRPGGKRRIVLATNIAETSVTVPGIHYVIDTGTARLSRYSTRTKVQRLPVEEISQASARQRSGRSGRTADGIAIRLYSEDNFLARPEFTDPEILRTNLASVILSMAALGLGDIADFPFVQAPDQRAIRDGITLLNELGALTGEEKSGMPVLTPVGEVMAQLPIDPRMARMLVAASESDCLHEVTVIVAALSLQDVRERPLEFQAQADQLHARFRDPSSDFFSYLNLWNYIAALRAELSGNGFAKRVRKEFLHYMRIREWRDLYQQLRRLGTERGWSYNASDLDTPSGANPVSGDSRGTSQQKGHLAQTVKSAALTHRAKADAETAFENPPITRADDISKALLSGLLGHIGIRAAESKEYLGTRNTRFMIFPGSALAKRNLSLVMTGELVETSRLWARDVGAIQPEWVEELGAHLIKRSYSDPIWSAKRQAAMVNEKVSLLGVPLIADRQVPYDKVDKVAARDMFIRHALVAGEWTTHHSFFHANQEKLAEAAELEEKARRRDLVIDEEALFAFYDDRIPPAVTTGIRFDRWWKKKRIKHPDLLDFDPEKLLHDHAQEVTEEAFPATWHQGSLEFELKYSFNPGASDDGVTMMIPVPLLAGVTPNGTEWLVPGLRHELVTAYLRSLPKHIRRMVVPVPDVAEQLLEHLRPGGPPLAMQLAQLVTRRTRIDVSHEDFQVKDLPDHLKMGFAAVDRRGKIIDRDRNLSALQERQAAKIRSSVRQKARQTLSDKAREFSPELLTQVGNEIVTKVDGQEVASFPALVTKNGKVTIEAFPTRAEADQAMLATTLAQLVANCSVNTKRMLNGLTLKQRVAIDRYPHGGADGFVEDIRVASIRDLLVSLGGPTTDPEAFAKLQSDVQAALPSTVRQSVVLLAPALVAYLELASELEQWSGGSIDDMKAQLAFLFPAHAVTTFGMDRMKHVPRYLQAMRIRLENLESNPDRDDAAMDQLEPLEAALQKRLAQLPKGSERTRAVKDIQWMLQEFRVSLFAQRLGTPSPISAKRILNAIDALGRG